MSEPNPADWRRLLRAQAGAVSRAQVLARGITDEGIAAQLAARRWQRAFGGVYYTFGGPPPVESRRWAALLLAGPGSMLSHETAADLWGIGDASPGQPIHVTVGRPRRLRRRAEVVAHCTRRTPYAIGSPPRTPSEATVFDLAGTRDRVEEALAVVARACQRRITTKDRLYAELQARPTQRWRGPLLATLGDLSDGAHSVLELRYAQLERAHGLPAGLRQRRVAGTFSDVHYEQFRVTVELDGRLGHQESTDRWRDMARDNASALRGEITLRYGWADVAGRGCAVAQQVAEILCARGWQGRLRACGSQCTPAVAGQPRFSA